MASLLLFIDFRKAFDLVNSKLLIHKLHHLGFSQSALKLVTNYFENRSQKVKLNGILSNKEDIKLGVPQGSVLGPLFFTLFINDMQLLIKNLSKKLFADDTTFYKSMFNVNELVSYFVSNIQPLLDWCYSSKLDLNWSKTFFLFIKNKRVKYPDHIFINNNRINVVDTFKLLGVTLDSKLSFDSFITDTKRAVNVKLYSIKRLFYLSYNVKLQFFKSFIIPHFDYCITLCIYFPKASLQRLCNFYYLCIYKLFKLNFSNNTTFVNNYLESINLFSFQHHLLFRLSTFLFKQLNNFDSPFYLKCLIKKQKNPFYNLRSNSVNSEKKFCIKNHFGESTCNYFFTKLFILIGPSEFYLNFSFFKNRVYNNINILFDLFTVKFPKYDLNTKNFNYFKT